MSEFPKALYRGARYTDWQVLCNDLALGKIESFVATDAEQEKARRADGFGDAAELMQPLSDVALTVPTEKKWANMNGEERRAYKASKAQSVDPD